MSEPVNQINHVEVIREAFLRLLDSIGYRGTPSTPIEDLPFAGTYPLKSLAAMQKELEEVGTTLHEANLQRVKMINLAAAQAERIFWLEDALGTAKEAMSERRGYCEAWEWKYGQTWDEEDAKVAAASPRPRHESADLPNSNPSTRQRRRFCPSGGTMQEPMPEKVSEEMAEAQLQAQIKIMAPLVNPMEAISREAERERGRILNLIRAKHGRDFENVIRETLGLPRNY